MSRPILTPVNYDPFRKRAAELLDRFRANPLSDLHDPGYIEELRALGRDIRAEDEKHVASGALETDTFEDPNLGVMLNWYGADLAASMAYIYDGYRDVATPSGK